MARENRSPGRARYRAWWDSLSPAERRWFVLGRLAIKRAKERLGLELTGLDLLQLRYDIWRGKRILLSKNDDFCLYLLKIKGQPVCVGFSESAYQIVTFRRLHIKETA